MTHLQCDCYNLKSQLQNLNADDCMEMPELNEGDARSLFLYHAGPSLNLDFGDEGFEDILKQCVQRCYCGKGDYSKSGHYHPLALKVLGGQLGSDPREWIDKLNELDPYNPNDEKDHPVFSIIGKSFEMLTKEHQFIFMDVAIYFPKIPKRYFPKKACVFSHESCNVFKWLSMVHGISLVDMKRKLEGLKSKSLLENVGDGTETVGMHDLWREFAMKKSEGGHFDPRPWIYETVYGRDHPKSNELILPRRGRWKNLQRLCLAGDDRVEGCPMEEIDLGCYSDLTVLKLRNVYTDTGMLDVSALTQLRSLEIVYSRSQSLNIHGLNCLVFFHCDADYIRMGSVHEESGDLTRLPSWPTTPDFSNLNRLRDLSLLGCKKADWIAGLSSDMTNLKRLQICGCSSLRRCPGVGDLVALEELNLSDCSKLEEFPNLGRLKHLLKLDISRCGLIKVVPGLSGLVSLQEFTANSCSKLAKLPEMCKLVNLQRLHVARCPSLKAIPGLSDLVGLEVLRVSSGGLEGCHDLQKLTKLESVWVKGWGADGLACLGDLVNLKSLEIVEAGELTGLLDLTRIERLRLAECYFERLPDMHKLSKLEKLEIGCCGSLREWKIGSGLRLFGVDLHVAGTFPRLKILDLCEVALSELTDLSSFPQLSELSLFECRELTSLTSSAPLTALKRLDLGYCSSLRALPDVSHLVSLSAFKLKECGELKLTAHEMEKLETMCPGLKLDQSHLSDMELEHDHDERDAKRLKVF